MRTTGAAAACVMSKLFDNPYRVTASYIKKNTTGESDLTLYITITVTIGFISFEYKLWTEVQSYGKLSYLQCTIACPGMYVRRCRDA